VQDNLKILNQLSFLHRLGFPLLLGPSRKSFLGKILETEVSQRVFGTAASVAASVIRGAHIVRVHEVREMRQVVDIADAIMNETA
jgi:dihydropteroate synthase